MSSISQMIYLKRNFWYRACRLIYGNIKIGELQSLYPRPPGIQAAYNHLQELDNVNLSVEKQGLVGYGQIVSSACDTVATAYNNFYVENYETRNETNFAYSTRCFFNSFGFTKLKIRKNLILLVYFFLCRCYSVDHVIFYIVTLTSISICSPM
ncbi:uncharacterized protein BX663DRAFT_542733 [Cokeromyces recurvatus]|uniref:uncharacterized protein n=1 Tax=Cokeromyces recurvatus TaxID=90255 RepID=UPI0022203152|nr:uncharacterized protein BX663DRAFT_542733 [Cokeromyces recurvatus]KAI7903241.1 hypothetical protein BX663DRAFT_542733 [Cokeromyces recurvatus]